MKQLKLEIFKILKARYESKHGTKLSKNHKELFASKIKNAFEEDRISYSLDNDLKLKYFFIFRKVRMPELDEEFFYISDCYVDSNSRRQFYLKVNQKFHEIKKATKIKRMFIEIFSEDLHLKKYYLKKGFLSYKLLVGNVNESLVKLNELKSDDHSYQIETAKQKDLNSLIKLDIESNLDDPTSRMHKTYKKMKSTEGVKRFYNYMIKNKNLIILKKNKEILGSVAYFINEELKEGSIASIFVSKKSQGQGVGKELYFELLKIFKKKKIKVYLGSSTTAKVLSLSERIGRVEYSSGIIVK